MWLLKIDTMISGKFVMIDYDINCLKIDIDVLCDAWLILALIYLLSRQLTPWHFFQVLSIEDRAKTKCIAIESKVGPMNHEHPIAFLKLVYVAIDCLKMHWRCVEYAWFTSGICNELSLYSCKYVLEEIYGFKLVLKCCKLELKLEFMYFPSKFCKFKFEWFSLKLV